MPSLPQGFLLSLPGLSPPHGALLPPIFVTPQKQRPAPPTHFIHSPAPSMPPPHHTGGSRCHPLSPSPLPSLPQGPTPPSLGCPGVTSRPRGPTLVSLPSSPIYSSGMWHRQGTARVTQGTGGLGDISSVPLSCPCVLPLGVTVSCPCASPGTPGVTKHPHLCHNSRDPSSVTASCP